MSPCSLYPALQARCKDELNVVLADMLTILPLAILGVKQSDKQKNRVYNETVRTLIATLGW